MNIINIQRYRKLKKSEKKTMALQEIVLEVQGRTRANNGSSVHDLVYAEQIADRTLKELIKLDQYTGNETTPIIRLLSELDFFVFNNTLGRNVCGLIQINKEDRSMLDAFGNSQVIILNEQEELGHARFVAAHELGHYIFEYDGVQKQFMNTYMKNAHSNHIEQICNRFAASLLMPKDLFIKQYCLAQNEIDDIDFIVYYLSRFFKTSKKSIKKRVWEVFEYA